MAYKTIYWKDKATKGISTRSFGSKKQWENYKKKATYKAQIKSNKVSKAKYDAFRADTKAAAKADAKRAKLTKDRVARARANTGETKGGHDVGEQARNIAQAARNKQVDKYVGKGESYGLGIAKSQAEDAKIADKQIGSRVSEDITQMRREGQARADEDYAKGVAKVQGQGMQINDIPVILNEQTGRLEYDVAKIGEAMGLSADQVKEYTSVRFPTSRDTRSTAQGIDDMVGGQINRNKEASDRDWSRSTGKLSDTNAAILNNLSVLDPLAARVDATKEDHMYNLSKAGHFQGLAGNRDVHEMLGDSPAPSGMGKYAQKYMVPAIGAAMIAMTGGTASPFLTPAVAGGVGALTSAQQGGDWQDILKSAAMGAGTSYMGSQTGELVSGIGGAGIGGDVLRGTLQGGLTGLGNEALGTIVAGEDFNLGDVAKGAATGGAQAGATGLASKFFNETDAGGAIKDAFTGDEGAVAPSSLEVSASPGDIGDPGDSLISAPNVDQARLAGTNLGYGTGAGIGDITMDSGEIVPGGSFSGTHEQTGLSTGQDPTGPAIDATGMGAIPQDPVMQGPTGPGVETPLGNLPSATDTGMWAGVTDQDVDRAYRGVDQTNYPAIQSDFEGINEDIRLATGTDIQSDFENINKEITDANALSYQSDWEGINKDIEDAQEPTPIGQERSTWGEFGKNLIGPLLSNLAGTLQDGGGGSNRQRSGTGIGGGSVTAGQYDPSSELQIGGTGAGKTNPALVASQYDEMSVDPEEQKKRRQLWSGNPLVSGLESNEYSRQDGGIVNS